MKKWIFATFVLILAVVGLCILWPTDRELGDGYYYLPKYESIDVGYENCEAIVYKSASENLFSDIKIRGDVISVNSNRNFIVAAQSTPIGCIDEFVLDGSSIRHLSFFIIVKKTDSLYGPYLLEGYLKKREELKVPDKLKLKFKTVAGNY